MLNQLDVFKLRVISELVKTESLLQAARNLKVTSSALSQNIKNLERTTGQSLFIRVGKSIKPTPLALEIERVAKPFFAELISVLEKTDEKVLSLKIGAPILFGSSILLDKLDLIMTKYPSFQFNLSLSVTNKIIDDLLNGKIDFGFIDDGPHTKMLKSLHMTPYFNEELILCCSQNFYHKYLRHGHSLKILKYLPHIPYHEGKEGIYKWYFHHYKRVPDLKWTISIDNPLGVLKAILKNWGLGVIPKSLALEYPKSIHVVPGTKSDLKSTIMLAQNLSKVPSQIEKELIKLIIKN